MLPDDQLQLVQQSRLASRYIAGNCYRENFYSDRLLNIVDQSNTDVKDPAFQSRWDIDVLHQPQDVSFDSVVDVNPF